MFMQTNENTWTNKNKDYYLLENTSFQTFPLLIYVYIVMPQDMPIWVKRIILYEEFHLALLFWLQRHS